jgi:hypothetical protein
MFKVLVFFFLVFNISSGLAGPLFGTVEDVAYAKALWLEMTTAGLVGPDKKRLEPFFGGAKPHGEILEIISQNLNLAGHEGFIVVKKNYDETGATLKTVKVNRAKYLSSITVMFQREMGYDLDHQNWFWAKYKPDGSFFTKSIENKNIPLVGRVAKGKTADDTGGCLYCHASAGGGDYIFYPKVKRP